MKLRKLVLLASASALLALGPASAQTSNADNRTPTVKTDVQKKPEKKAQKKPTKKVANKNENKKSDKKNKKEVVKAEPERKPGLFSVLFGGPIKDKTDKPAKVDPKAKKATASVAKRQPAQPVEEEVTQASLNDNRPIELRSDVKREQTLFSGLFGGNQARMLPETERRDRYLRQIEAKKGAKRFVPKEEFMPRVVDFSGSYKRGTIVVNTAERRLYLIESGGKARRYAIAVGKEGLEFKGAGTVGDKQEWPRWIPTQDMQKRDPKKYGQYKDGMDGGPNNPLGARAIYLYQGKKDTHIRIHGTTEPWTIGTNASNGCFRMVNEHVMDLYNRVTMGAQIVVL